MNLEWFSCVYGVLSSFGYQHKEKGKKNPHSGQISRGCIGTGQSCTDTNCVLPLVLYFDQCSYFGHNLVIYDPI